MSALLNHLHLPHLVYDRTQAEAELAHRARVAAENARDFARTIRKADGHWCAEIESNVTITAEWVFMAQALGLDLSDKRDALIRYFRTEQKTDGSYGLAWNHAGDVSSTAETYLAMRILGVEIDDPDMLRMQTYIRDNGGLETMRVFTRINFALFGLFPWSAVPTVPPELILVPEASPASIYALSSWARGTIVPLLILFHLKPLYELPNGKRPDNDWLDHLWLNPANKEVPYSAGVRNALKTFGVSWKSFFTITDKLLQAHEKLRNRGLPGLSRLRQLAIRKCEQWTIERQEENGDWAGIFPPMLNAVLAFHALGQTTESKHLKLGLEALERFMQQDENGLRCEPCQSPVWDTILMMVGLLDCGFDDENIGAAREWITKLQIFEDKGDWKVHNPKARPGGWSFEYANTWYPDVDDSAAIISGFLKHDPGSAKTESVERAVEWITSMQNDDGGWAAFDRNNDKLYLNDIPFSDMAALCDPSSADVTGRVLEMLGILDDRRFDRMAKRGLDYLRKEQEPEGSWYGRWGVNYVYGTSNVLCALSRQKVPAMDPMPRRAIAWLRSVQNEDGGWGECLESYGDRTLMGKGTSTASQTAWAVMGLLAFLPPTDASIERGIAWLLDRQNEKGSWDEKEYTGTGFPNHFYLRYNLYRHYFPMMALGRFTRAKR